MTKPRSQNSSASSAPTPDAIPAASEQANPSEPEATAAQGVVDAQAVASELPITPVVAKTPGELLRFAREAQGVSAGEIASRLRMSVKQVQALEAADYKSVPSGTFLRGFVRSYAKHVQVDPAVAIALLESSTRDAAALEATAIVAPTQNIQLARGEQEIARERARILIVVAVLAVASVIVFYWWNYVRPYRGEGGRPQAVEKASAAQSLAAPPVVNLPAVPAEDASSVPSAKVVEPSATLTQSLADPNPIRQPVTITPEPVKSTAPASATPPALAIAKSERSANADPSPRRSGGEGLLGFTFRGESWVEVVDASGKTVLSRRFVAGEVGEVSGRVPLSVVIGNAPSTRMAYNGQEFDLSPHTRVAVARVTIK